MAPPYLSVEYDHNAETVYFLVDRYYELVDLSTLFCVIQYENASPIKEERGHIYPVPYFDISSSFVPEGKMIFPWRIQGAATAYAGDVTFSVKFYRIRDFEIDNDAGQTRTVKEYEYVLNTKPATSKVLHGMDIYATTNRYELLPDTIEEIYSAIGEIANHQQIFWTKLTDPDDNLTQHTNPSYEGVTDKSDDVYNVLQ